MVKKPVEDEREDEISTIMGSITSKEVAPEEPEEEKEEIKNNIKSSIKNLLDVDPESKKLIKKDPEKVLATSVFYQTTGDLSKAKKMSSILATKPIKVRKAVIKNRTNMIVPKKKSLISMEDLEPVELSCMLLFQIIL